MAPMCLVQTQGHWYCADREVSSSPKGPRVDPDWGVFYAKDAPVLCGNWLCGGPLDFQAASIVGRRPSHAVPVTGPSVERFFRAWACAPLRLHFVSARPLLLILPEVTVTKVCLHHPVSSVSPYNWLRGALSSGPQSALSFHAAASNNATDLRPARSAGSPGTRVARRAG